VRHIGFIILYFILMTQRLSNHTLTKIIYQTQPRYFIQCHWLLFNPTCQPFQQRRSNPLLNKVHEEGGRREGSVSSIVCLQCLSATPLKAFRQGFCFVFDTTSDRIRSCTTPALCGPKYSAVAILRDPSVGVFVRADALKTSFPLQ
jgi:hypothetical protein